MKENGIIIPALEPEECLCDYIGKLKQHVSALIVVVDDGSGTRYRPVFDRISRIPDCVVLRHEENRGKGRALKTAMSYIRHNVPQIRQMVCVDCDGQHAPCDVQRILKEAQRTGHTLCLGGRDFSGEEVPLRSLFGNRISSCLFWLMSGKWIGDTQTGLRAFDRSLTEWMLSVPGERFEYETQMLLSCVKDQIPIKVSSIQTIYERGNSGSHFRPMRDSVQIVRILVSEMVRFGCVSALCALLDLWLFWVFVQNVRWNPLTLLFGHRMTDRAAPSFLWICAATAGARVISAYVNYILNRTYVFGRDDAYRLRRNCRRESSIWKYATLCIGVGLLSASSVFVLSRFSVTSTAKAKAVSDLLLFVVSYRIQKTWVFRRTERKEHRHGQKGEGRG